MKYKIALLAILITWGSSANAALVEFLISASTAESAGDIIYPDGSTYTARLVFDADYPDFNVGSTDVGSFFDFVDSALISAELATPLGTVTYRPSEVTGAIIGPQVSQIQIPNQQTFTVASANSLVAHDGFTGTITGLGEELTAFGLIAFGTGPNDYFFTDPNVLLSGNETLSTDGSVLGTITVSAARTGLETGLVFGDGDFTIQPVVVPLPAAAWLLGSALGLLGWRGLKAS